MVIAYGFERGDTKENKMTTLSILLAYPHKNKTPFFLNIPSTSYLYGENLVQVVLGNKKLVYMGYTCIFTTFVLSTQNTYFVCVLYVFEEIMRYLYIS